MQCEDETPKLYDLPDFMPMVPERTVIFCEGERTEPLYLGAIAQEINARFAPYTMNEPITVVGTGYNTQGLFDYAVRTVESDYPDCAQAYLVYDRDEFPTDRFDNTAFRAGMVGGTRFHAIWSNRCVELWFLLHFQWLDADVDKKRYRAMLRRYIPYEKNRAGLYAQLRERTPLAIRRARALYESYDEKAPPSKRCPATKMYELVEYLTAYLR
jgi:hypothetical protein